MKFSKRYILYVQGGENTCQVTITVTQTNFLVPGVRQALDQMKNEIANEFGVNLGADSTSRANGSVGGEITKRLVRQAQATNERSK